MEASSVVSTPEDGPGATTNESPSVRSSIAEDSFFDALAEGVNVPIDAQALCSASPRGPEQNGLSDEIDLARRAVAVEEVEDDCCPICIDAFTTEDPGMETACNHSYHLQCIMQWAQRSRECPLCFKALQLKDPDMNELLPFGEYVPPASSRQPAPSQSLLVGLEGWELERLLHRLALVQDGRGSGGPASAAALVGGSRRSRSSRRGHLMLSRSQVQSLRERTMAQHQNAAAAARASKPAVSGSDTQQQQQAGSSSAGAGGSSEDVVGTSNRSSAGGGRSSENDTARVGWSLPRGRATSGGGSADGGVDSHIIITADGGGGDDGGSGGGGNALSPLASCRQNSATGSPVGGGHSKSGLLARCKESFCKTTRELRRALFKSPSGSQPETPTSPAASAASSAPPPAAAATTPAAAAALTQTATATTT